MSAHTWPDLNSGYVYGGETGELGNRHPSGKKGTKLAESKKKGVRMSTEMAMLSGESLGGAHKKLDSHRSQGHVRSNTN